MSLAFKLIDSPVGKLKLVASDEGLVGIAWENDHPLRVGPDDLVENPAHPTLLRAEKELNEYFSGKRKAYKCGRHCLASRSGKRALTASLRFSSAIQRPRAQSARQMDETRYRLSCRAIASSDSLGSSQALGAGLRKRTIYSSWKGAATLCLSSGSRAPSSVS